MVMVLLHQVRCYRRLRGCYVQSPRISMIGTFACIIVIGIILLVGVFTRAGHPLDSVAHFPVECDTCLVSLELGTREAYDEVVLGAHHDLELLPKRFVIGDLDAIHCINSHSKPHTLLFSRASLHNIYHCEVSVLKPKEPRLERYGDKVPIVRLSLCSFYTGKQTPECVPTAEAQGYERHEIEEHNLSNSKCHVRSEGHHRYECPVIVIVFHGPRCHN
mmetsp:Transcript_18216/g.36735  ORF Transcript_18216/g.36735 Transcript_18216/m.36735 type:complete len:218 (-) Transcript_18216:7613-8266(-)